LVLYPNPAVDEIWINLPEGYDGVWLITDATGRIMRPEIYAKPGTTQRIGLENLASGAYTLQLMDGPIEWSSRFVVGD
jgi:hypothetical protein